MNQPKVRSSLPPFLVSTVPKSGTHLIHQMLNGMPGVFNDITNLETKFFVHNPPQNFYQDHERRLAKLQPNQFGLGHLYYTNQYQALLEKYRLKHIFVYRDPRDVLLSLAYFIPSKWGEHPLHETLKPLSIKERCILLLEGTDTFPTYLAFISPFYEWLNNTHCYHVSFEELISEQKRKQTLLGIAQFLWKGLTPPIPFPAMVSQMEQQIDPSTSRTFRKGKIGGWKDEFDHEVKSVFKKRAGSLVIKTGYAKDNLW